MEINKEGNRVTLTFDAWILENVLDEFEEEFEPSMVRNFFTRVSKVGRIQIQTETGFTEQTVTDAKIEGKDYYNKQWYSDLFNARYMPKREPTARNVRDQIIYLLENFADIREDTRSHTEKSPPHREYKINEIVIQFHY